MAILQEYFRPGSVEEALQNLADGGGRRTALAGGTQLVGQLETRTRPELEGVVDLRGIGLNDIRVGDGVFRVGALCTLAEIVSVPALRELADGLLVRASRGEGPSNLRNAATIGGVVACAESDSEFYAALLAMGARVTSYSLNGVVCTVTLESLNIVDGLITEVVLPMIAMRSGAARIARTPSDRPIVAAFAVVDGSSECVDKARVALCGVADRPVLAGSALDPPDDYKGSAAYRLAMTDIVIRRAIAQLGSASMGKAAGYAA